MKPRLILSLLMSALLLAACYRQAEEPFQQIDSAEVVVDATATPLLAEDATGLNTTPGEYVTPETAPGQVEQPTLAPQNSEPTAPLATLEPIARPTATLDFEAQLDPDDECVYEVQAGNVLFRLALAWGTTYQTIMDVNQMDSEDLSIGQLLLIPGCESSEPETPTPDAVEPPTEEDAPPILPAEATVEEAAEEEAPAEAVPTEAPEPTATPLPAIHVVSAGETIESISLRYRVDVNELVALNQLANPDRVNVGQELKLPQS